MSESTLSFHCGLFCVLIKCFGIFGDTKEPIGETFLPFKNEISLQKMKTIRLFLNRIILNNTDNQWEMKKFNDWKLDLGSCVHLLKILAKNVNMIPMNEWNGKFAKYMADLDESQQKQEISEGVYLERANILKFGKDVIEVLHAMGDEDACSCRQLCFVEYVDDIHDEIHFIVVPCKVPKGSIVY